MLDPFKILSQPAMSSVYDEVGTKCSGYAEDGPYRCEDCIHKTKPTEPYCIHPMVLNDPELQHKVEIIDGRPVVEINLHRGCCRFVQPPQDEHEPHPHDDATGVYS